MVIVSGNVLTDTPRGVLYSSPNAVKLTVKIKLHNYNLRQIVYKMESPEAVRAQRKEQQKRALSFLLGGAADRTQILLQVRHVLYH
jgi:hypothetical protein